MSRPERVARVLRQLLQLKKKRPEYVSLVGTEALESRVGSRADGLSCHNKDPQVVTWTQLLSLSLIWAR